MSSPTVDLSGQVAIVTGGGRGIGQSIAQALAKAGAAVAVTGRTTATLDETVTLIQQAGGHALAVETDVTQRASVERMVQEVETKLGAIDLLVNNAGISGIPGPVAQADPDDWWQVLEVNLHGTFLCTRAVLPGMVTRQCGRIINVASGAGLIGMANGASYSTSKAAVIRFSDCLAEEVREHNIAVFVIDPGNVHTDMMTYLLESDEGKQYLPWLQPYVDSVQYDPPEMPANLVTLLASGQADGLVGCFIRVRDDIETMMRDAEKIRQDELHKMRLRV
ncbi:MAG: SDR family oxidoreductase [Anaerolineae bacterium]